MLPSTALRLRWRGATMLAAWLVCELHWLYWAYCLEFLGRNTFLQVWGASLAFFGVNVGVVATLVSAHRVAPLFRAGELQGYPSAVAGGGSTEPVGDASHGAGGDVARGESGARRRLAC